jgi:hypothetical protein
MTGAIVGVLLLTVKPIKWLRVSDTAEPPQVDHRVPPQFHPIVPLAFPVKTRNFVRWHPLRALDEISTLINSCF